MKEIRQLLWGRPDGEEGARASLVGRRAATILAVLVIGAMVVRATRRDPGAALQAAPARVAKVEVPPSAPAPVIIPTPKFVPASARQLGQAVNDSALTTLVDNYLVAAARNDAATQAAMLQGLKRQPSRSRELLVERKRNGDAGSIGAVDRALLELQ